MSRTYQGPDLTDILPLNGVLTHSEQFDLAAVCAAAGHDRVVARAFGSGGLYGFDENAVNVVYARASHLIPKDENPRSDIRDASLRVQILRQDGKVLFATSETEDWPLRELVADLKRGFFNPDHRDEDGNRAWHL